MKVLNALIATLLIFLSAFFMYWLCNTNAIVCLVIVFIIVFVAMYKLLN